MRKNIHEYRVSGLIWSAAKTGSKFFFLYLIPVCMVFAALDFSNRNSIGLFAQTSCTAFVHLTLVLRTRRYTDKRHGQSIIKLYRTNAPTRSILLASYEWRFFHFEHKNRLKFVCEWSRHWCHCRQSYNIGIAIRVPRATLSLPIANGMNANIYRQQRELVNMRN